MVVVFPGPLKRYFGGTGRTATRMLARFEGYNLIIE
jgi:hypothetical protein